MVNQGRVGATIDAGCLNIGDLFSDFYRIPAYQREYIWIDAKNEDQENQVIQFLNDIHEPISNADYDGNKAEQYFIGSIVVCPTESKVYQVIDGQQRLVTILLLLCSIRNNFNNFESCKENSDVLEVINRLIKNSHVDTLGHAINENRITLQYQDSENVLSRIINNQNISETNGTKAINNIKSALQTIDGFLNESIESSDHLTRFFGYLNSKVMLVRISTESVSSALQLFETMNHRGVSLNSFDLIKNRLFMSLPSEEYEEISNKWKHLSDYLNDMKERPLRFMRYFVFSKYSIGGNKLTENSVFDWFDEQSKDNDQLKIDIKSPLSFVNLLTHSAQNYKRFHTDGQDYQGKPNARIKNMKILGGSAARQHLIVLLAASRMNELEKFNRIAEELEKCMFIFLLTKKTSQTIESAYQQWAKTIQSLNGEESFNNLLSDMKETRYESVGVFKQIFSELSMGDIQRYRLKYVLAKLSQHIDRIAYDPSDESICKYMDDYQIEHIFPQDPEIDAQNEFGRIEVDNISQRLGNLTLLESSINTALSNGPYSKKREIYSESKLLLTKCIYQKATVGKNTKIDIAVNKLKQFENWNERNVIKRQEMFYEFAQEIWLD